MSLFEVSRDVVFDMLSDGDGAFPFVIIVKADSREPMLRRECGEQDQKVQIEAIVRRLARSKELKGLVFADQVAYAPGNGKSVLPGSETRPALAIVTWDYLHSEAHRCGIFPIERVGHQMKLGADLEPEGYPTWLDPIASELR